MYMYTYKKIYKSTYMYTMSCVHMYMYMYYTIVLLYTNIVVCVSVHSNTILYYTGAVVLEEVGIILNTVCVTQLCQTLYYLMSQQMAIVP